MAKEKPLIINAPRQGIAQSPHVGFGDVRNLNIMSYPGVAILNNELDKESATTVDAQITWMVKNPASPANLYAIDTNGSVYTSANSGDTWSELADKAGAGQGLAVWKDYLFVAEAAKLHTYGPLSGAADWLEFQTDLDTDSAWHPMLVSKLDGKLYIGAGKYIAVLSEGLGQNFADGNGATYTWTPQALDLPEDYRVKCLAELGNNLMIGTWVGSNIDDNKIADIFPWDGSSTEYGKPVQIVDNGINAMLNTGNSLIVLAGVDGIIYKSDGYTAVPIARIPRSIADLSAGKYIEPYPGAIINFKGRPFFGVSGGGTSAIDGMGIYSLMETSSGTILNHEHTISTGNSGASNVCKVSALLGITRDQLIAGWRDNTTYGIDMTDVSDYSTGNAYSGYFESPLYVVGTYTQPKTFTRLELQLAKELASAEGVRVSYRINLTDTWTVIGTYDYTTLGAVATHTDNAQIPACEFLQIKVELDGDSTTPHFKSLILR